MKKGLVAVVVLVLLVAAGGAGGLYLYDSSRDGTIAEGVTIAGIDVGGMKVTRARALLDRKLARPLARPVRVRAGKHVFVLTPARAGVKLDEDRMLADARAASRNGNFLARAWRDLTGGAVDKRVPLEVTYSARRVHRFVARVARVLARRPLDARVSYTLTSVHVWPARRGRELKEHRLARALASRLVRPGSDRTLRAPMRSLAPKVTSVALANEFSHFITISRRTKVLRLFVDFRLAKTYRIAVGRVGYETPGGLYHIQDKAINPAWHVPNSPWAGKLAGKVIPGGAPNNPLVARWMGFYDGAGIHGTNEPGSIGRAASHGCIRMRVPDVIDLYPRVPVGAPVFIV